MDPSLNISQESLTQKKWCQCCPCARHFTNRISEVICGAVPEERVRQGEEKITLLLLGGASTGKSTLLKQARLIYGNGFPEERRRTYVDPIRSNIVQCMCKIIQAMISLQVEYQNAVLENMINEHDFTNVQNILLMDKKIVLDTDYIVDCVNLMLEDEGVLEVIDRGDEIHLMENTMYLFEKVETIFSESYLPTIDDTLRMRFPTSGVFTDTFNIDGRKYIFHDVGGQRGERKKWIHCFDGVKVIMFLASIAEYDQNLELPKHENLLVNRMKDSLSIFHWIMSYQYFEDVTTVLFLNKHDIFVKKIMKSDICDHFPEYEGPRQDAEAGESFIRDMFLQHSKSRYVYAHTVQCTDTTGAFEAIFKTTTEEISRRYIGDLV